MNPIEAAEVLPPRGPAVLHGLRGILALLAAPGTYLPHRNPFALFGLLWGIPVPVATLLVAVTCKGLPVSFESIGWILSEHPVQWWFVAHPVLFTIAFGALGTGVQARDRRIASLVEQLKVRADTDGLTGLLNHRYFHERVRQEADRAERTGEGVSLLLVDLDRFKEFNDRFGHLGGDAALQAVAGRLTEHVRPYDIVCRYGGEEFAIVMPGADGHEAARVAGRLREVSERNPVHLPSGAEASVTLSVGVATRRTGEPVRSWIERTDRALYRAKAEGRNRVCSDSPAAVQG